MTPPCVFCTRIAGGEYDSTSDMVYNFEPLNPVTPGHRLFVPSEHVAAAATTPGVTGRVFKVASQWAAGAGEAFNLITSAGGPATQTVQHLHVHYVPRRFDDGLALPWTR